MADEQYYGVAWNYEDDSYVLTGSLLGATPENIDERMFVHNTVESDVVTMGDGCYEIPKIYERRFCVGTAFVVEVSLLPLIGFSLCRTIDVVKTLYLMERGIWRSLGRPNAMNFSEFGDGETTIDDRLGTPIQKPFKQPIDGVYTLPSVYDEDEVVGWYVEPHKWGHVDEMNI